MLTAIFFSDILPIFLVAGVGFLLARHVRLDVNALARLSFHALAPCLVFTLLVTSAASGPDLARMALFSTLVTLGIGLVAWLVVQPLRLGRTAMVGFLLVVMFSNGGNFGLALVEFAFHDEALTFAAVYFVTSATLAYTLGVFLAAAGRRSAREALIGLRRVPTLYAVGAALVVMELDVAAPLDSCDL